MYRCFPSRRTKRDMAAAIERLPFEKGWRCSSCFYFLSEKPASFGKETKGLNPREPVIDPLTKDLSLSSFLFSLFSLLLSLRLSFFPFYSSISLSFSLSLSMTKNKRQKREKREKREKKLKSLLTPLWNRHHTPSTNDIYHRSVNRHLSNALSSLTNEDRQHHDESLQKSWYKLGDDVCRKYPIKKIALFLIMYYGMRCLILRI